MTGKSLLVIIVIFLSSCAMLGDKLVLKKTEFSELYGWEKDTHSEALKSFLKSCKKMSRMPLDRRLHPSGVGGTYKDWVSVCSKAKYTKNAKTFFEENFIPHSVSNWSSDEGLFTGYYEAELNGNRTRHSVYKYPIYKRPPDFKSGEKYYIRKKIENGVLAGKGLELAWVDDPVELFFLHVQGSGRVRLNDGSVMRIGFDSKNGHGYKSIGRYMIDKGYLKEGEVTAESIKNWLYRNPSKQTEVFNQNPSFIFFRELSGDGPVGGQGVALTPERSLAIDKSYIPYGVPVFVDVKTGGKEETGNFEKLMVAQDTGSAIKGIVRGDIFFGYGKKAESLAGHQNNIGRYFILLPKK